MINSVIFDFDGLIADTEMISYYCYRDMLKEYGITFTLDDYKKECPGKQMMTTLNFFKDKYHLDYIPDEKKPFFKDQEAYYMNKDGVQLKKGVKELLDYLKEHHYKICLATSSIEERAKSILEEHHIYDYFDEYVYGNEVKNGKPHPDVFIKASEKLHEPAENCLVLEDSENGIRAAYNAHIKVICIPDMKQPGNDVKDNCAAILPDLTYVINYLKEH